MQRQSKAFATLIDRAAWEPPLRLGASLRIECTHCAAADTYSGAEVVQCCEAGDPERTRCRVKRERFGQKAARLIVLPPD